MENIDLSKLKVADLKKELKIRGLPQTGKRNELLERLQEAIAGGIGLDVGAEDDEEYDEDEILGTGDDDDEDDKMTPLEEAAALAGVLKPESTPARGRRAAVASASRAAVTPASQRKVSLRRTAAAALTVSEEVPVAISPPVKTAHAAKASALVKKAAIAPATAEEPPKKALKLDTEVAAPVVQQENGAPPDEKSAIEKRAERFGVTSDAVAKQKRADRFGLPGDSSGKIKTDEPVDVDKLKARAERFGEIVAKKLTNADVEEKKKARLARFAEDTGIDSVNKIDVTSAEAKAARASKFASTPTAVSTVASDSSTPLLSASGKKLITFGGDDECKKLQRAARFAS